MKSIIISFITLSVVAVAAVFSIQHFNSPKDTLLMENIEALANDPTCLLFEGEGGGCEVSVQCSIGMPNSYVKCSGTVCERNAAERWVECDGHRTSC